MVSKDEQEGVPTLHPFHCRKPSNHTLKCCDSDNMLYCTLCVCICDSTCCWPWGFTQSVPTNLTFLCSGNCCCSVCSFARSTFDATHPWGMSTPHAVLYACYICSHAVLYACYICPHAVLYACYICPHAVLPACYMSTCSVICMLYVHIQCYMSASSVIYTPVCLLYCEPQTHRLLVPPEQYAMYTPPAFIL